MTADEAAAFARDVDVLLARADTRTVAADALKSAVWSCVNGANHKLRQERVWAVAAMHELVRRAEEAATLRTERDRLARILAVERGDESAAPAGWKRATESECEWELTPYDEENGPEWAIGRVIWTDGLPRWMRWGRHSMTEPREKIRTALEAMEAADLARGVHHD